MKQIALFTAECAQVRPALGQFIARNHERLALVVTSDISQGKRLGVARQVLTNLRRSGPAFVEYLSYSFVLYFAYARLDRLRAAITRTPRRCLTIAELCELYDIPCIQTADVNGPDVTARLAAADLDAIVIYWFDQIIHDHIVAIPSRAVINVHAALLPFCRGLFPVLYSATAHDHAYGITAHEIENTEIDAGPILGQVRVSPPPDGSILYRDAVVNRAGVDLICAILEDFDAYHARRSRPEGGSYFSYPDRVDIRDARRAGLRLASLGDFLAICRGELSHPAALATPAPAKPPVPLPASDGRLG